jgi:general secretion pathway protein L
MSVWVGIDVGNEAIKIAVLKTAYRKVALAGLATVSTTEQQFVSLEDTTLVGVTPAGAAASPEHLRIAALIKRAVESLLPKTGAFDGCAAALPGVQATFRPLALPASAQKQLAGVLPFELEALVPFDLEDAVYDYRVLSGIRALPGAEQATIPLLCVVARSNDVRARIDLVKDALGVEPERIGVGPLPFGNLIPFMPGFDAPEPTVILDLGLRSCDLLVVRAGEPEFARTLSVGTEGLPQSAPRLAREVRTSLNAYRANGGPPPARVFLCGGGAFQQGAESFLSSELELPVTFLPAPAIDLTEVPPEQVLELPRYAKAIGLAVGLHGRAIGLDLRRGPLAYERGYRWLRERVPVLAGLGAALLVSFVFSTGSQLYAEGRDRTVLEEAMGYVSKEVLGEETTSADRARELLGQQTSSPDDDPMPRIDAFDVMVKISEAIPQSMKHDIEELDIQKGHVVVHGIVGTIPDAESIKTSLLSEKCFSDVKITRTTQVVGGERQKYVMEFDLKCPEEIKGKKKDDKSAAAPATSGTGGK